MPTRVTAAPSTTTMKVVVPSSSSSSSLFANPPPRAPSRSGYQHFLAGQIGGMAGVATGQPFDTVKVLMQTSQKKIPRHPSSKCTKAAFPARTDLRRKFREKSNRRQDKAKRNTDGDSCPHALLPSQACPGIGRLAPRSQVCMRATASSVSTVALHTLY